jgi:hypothetical protein
MHGVPGDDLGGHAKLSSLVRVSLPNSPEILKFTATPALRQANKIIRALAGDVKVSLRLLGYVSMLQ